MKVKVNAVCGFFNIQLLVKSQLLLGESVKAAIVKISMANPDNDRSNGWRWRFNPAIWGLMPDRS
ncbi:hypothetical protein [Burkholderia diffusa]|uniref:hypothetical protein n=1 Tax=Burkholderia diffusa TaxID=488732 RepID=UPI000A573E7C|nr:hypothetical protein [Burkholderia diffusa]